MAQRTENHGQGTERDATRDRQVASTGRQLTPAAAATTTKRTTTTAGGDFQVKAAAAAIMQRAPASASTVAVPAPDTAPTAARAITMSRQSGKGKGERGQI